MTELKINRLAILTTIVIYGEISQIPLAVSYDQTPSARQIERNDKIGSTNDSNTVKYQSDRVIIKPDTLQIQKSGSTGTADGMTVGLGTLSEILSGETGLGTAAMYGISSANSSNINTARLKSAISLLGLKGGGTINFPCGDFYFSEVDNNVQGVLLRGPSASVGLRDAGDDKFCTRFIATQPGTFVKHRTPYHRGFPKFIGGGFENIFLDGAMIADRVLEVDTVSGGTYKGVVGRAVGKEAVLFKSGISKIDVADAADVQHTDIDLQCRQIDGTAANTSCYTLDGSSNANFSANELVRLTCKHANGSCLNGFDADNNRISLGAYRIKGGTGYTFVGLASSYQHGGFRENTFIKLGGVGPTYIAGATEWGANAGVRNEVANLDVENGAAIPTAGAGSVWYGSFEQTYSPVIICNQSLLTHSDIVTKYIRTAKEVSLYFSWKLSRPCQGNVSISLPTKTEANMASVGNAVERALTGNAYILLALPAASEMMLSNIPGGTPVSLSSGWVVSGHLQYLANF